MDKLWSCFGMSNAMYMYKEGNFTTLILLIYSKLKLPMLSRP